MSELDQFYNDSSLSTDFYELTMASAYFAANQSDKLATFEMFIRTLPKNRNYLVAAGLEQAIAYLLNLKFKAEHLIFLKTHDTFKRADNKFFDYLLNLKFTGNM